MRTFTFYKSIWKTSTSIQMWLSKLEALWRMKDSMCCLTALESGEMMSKFHQQISKFYLIHSPRSSFLGLKALKPNELMDAYAVNVVAPLMLTKAFIPLLKKTSSANKDAPLGVQRAVIVNMSSILGSIASNVEGSLYHYRVTKSGLNAATKSLSIDLKNDGILAVNMHPGWVKTDMGGPKAPLEVEQSCDGMVSTILKLDKSHNGGFIQYDGKALPW